MLVATLDVMNAKRNLFFVVSNVIEYTPPNSTTPVHENESTMRRNVFLYGVLSSAFGIILAIVGVNSL